jgi:hypothetical protein
LNAIQLTPDQHEFISHNAARPVRAIDPKTNREYVLVPADIFARLQALLDAEFQPSDAYPAIDNAFAEGWSDPRIGDYDRYEELKG